MIQNTSNTWTYILEPVRKSCGCPWNNDCLHPKFRKTDKSKITYETSISQLAWRMKVVSLGLESFMSVCCWLNDVTLKLISIRNDQDWRESPAQTKPERDESLEHHTFETIRIVRKPTRFSTRVHTCTQHHCYKILMTSRETYNRLKNAKAKDNCWKNQHLLIFSIVNVSKLHKITQCWWCVWRSIKQNYRSNTIL